MVSTPLEKGDVETDEKSDERFDEDVAAAIKTPPRDDMTEQQRAALTRRILLKLDFR